MPEPEFSAGMANLDADQLPELEGDTLFARFLHHDMVSSGMLLFAAAAAIAIANSAWAEHFHGFWETQFGFTLNEQGFEKSLHHWVNDGLMSIFFFLVGLEIKRELVAGELASLRKAVLPAAAAVGGMAVPAILYSIINFGGAGMRGWGIPMATDIAFAAGCIALMRKRVPAALMVFLVALAIVDDLGAVAVIAVFYAETIAIRPLLVGASLIVVSYLLNFLGVRRILPYIIFGIVIWIEFLQSGVHATVAGVLLAFTIPVKASYRTHNFPRRMTELLDRFVRAEAEWRPKDPDDPEPRISKELMVNQHQQSLLRHMNAECSRVEAPLQRLEYNIEPFAVFIVMPIFAFANAGVHIDWGHLGDLMLERVTIGVILGLLIGKPLGIMLVSWIAVKAGFASLPRGVSWMQLLGAGFLAGIGFTMSMFINGLAFAPDASGTELVDQGKIGIIIASFLAAITGLVILRFSESPVAKE